MATSRESDQRPQGADGASAFTPGYHREMLMDARRVGAFHRAIEHHGGPGRSFMELGVGTGIMSRHAARFYDHVYAVERDPVMHDVARDNFRRLDLLGSKVTLIHGNALEDDLPAADVIMAEMFSTLMVHEPQVPVMNRARGLVKPGGAMIPSRVVNTVALGWSKLGTQGIRFTSPYSLFTGVPQPETLSESRAFFTVDFMAAPAPRCVSATVEVECLFDSEINSLILCTLLQLAPGVTFSGSDSLNPPMVFPVEPVRAAAGDRVRITIGYEHFSDWSSFRGALEVRRT